MKPSIRVVIQSRLSSARLPAKALLPIQGIPSIVLCAKRAGNTGLDVCVATSKENYDDLIEEVLHRHQISVYRGPLDDVLGRYHLATTDLKPEDIVVRLTGDNLLPDGQFIQGLVDQLVMNKLSYLGTSSPEDGLPYGMSAEVFLVKALRKAQQTTLSVFDKEHVTPAIKQLYSDGSMYRVGSEHLPENANQFRCTMDDLNDYILVERAFAQSKNPKSEPWYKLVAAIVNAGT
jgi:spore coat polysaccharide biosynthesis protein SpsF (cytidylyltransferase family)